MTLAFHRAELLHLLILLLIFFISNQFPTQFSVQKQCNPNYFGPYCNVTTCYGINSNDTRNVCSGYGDCVGFNNCSCLFDFNPFLPSIMGERCQNTRTYMTISMLIISCCGICCCLLISCCFFVTLFNCCSCCFSDLKFNVPTKNIKDQNETIPLLEHKRFITKSSEMTLTLVSSLGDKGCYKGYINSTTITVFVKKIRFKSSQNANAIYNRSKLILDCHITHPNVMPLFGLYLESSATSNGVGYYQFQMQYAISSPSSTAVNLCSVMPFSNRGNLSQYLLQNKSVWNIRKTIAFGCQLMSGISCLHSYSIVHNNLKPQNILIAKSAQPLQSTIGDLQENIEEEILFVIGDFEFAMPLESPYSSNASGSSADSSSLSSRQILESHYLSPEVRVGNYMTLSTDIFSAAVILFEVITGTAEDAGRRILKASLSMNPEEKLSEFYNEIRRALANHCDNQELIDIILKMLHHDPKKRPSALEAVQHLKTLSSRFRSDSSTFNVFHTQVNQQIGELY